MFATFLREAGMLSQLAWFKLVGAVQPTCFMTLLKPPLATVVFGLFPTVWQTQQVLAYVDSVLPVMASVKMAACAVLDQAGTMAAARPPLWQTEHAETPA